MAIPPLVLRIYADSSGVKKGVASAQAQVNGMRASISRNAGLIKTALGVAIAVGLVKSVQAAGDLGEAMNAVDVTFKKNAATVKAWAKQAATSAGLAEAEALQAAAGIGAMFDSAGISGQRAAEMAVDVNQLAADLGSLRNADPTEMLDRMRAGLAGEAEPLRKFGIFLSEAAVQQEAVRMGLVEVGEELTDAQKIQARYNIILEQGSEASGDFARTAGESLPNQLRMLRAQLINVAASIGKVLLPAVTALLGWINKGISRLGEFARVVDKEVGPSIRLAWTEVKKLWQELKPLLEELAPVAKLLGAAFLNNLRATAFAVRALARWIRFLVDTIRTLVGWVTTAVQKLNELRQAMPSGPGGIPLLPGSAAGILGGLLADGGPAMAGNAYIVGERGPELFVPRVSGTVIPNGQAAGTTIVFNGDVYGWDDFQRRVSQALAEQVRRAS